MKRALVAILLALACREPITPSRTATYGFSGPEVFHWPAERLPVRFYTQPAGNLRLLVQRSVDTWEAQFLYGEFHATFVADSADADVIVVWSGGVPPDVPPDPGPPVYACTGVTSVPAIDAGDRYTGPFRIQLSGRPGFSAAQVAACLRPTAIHEVGHALGLFQHSPDAGDIMWGPSPGAPLAVHEPSEQDRRTVEVLYHTQATVFPPPP